MHMMTSSNGTIFRVTGPLCGEFTGPGEFPAQWPVTRSFDVFFDLRLNKRLSEQPWGWWFETPGSLWRQRNLCTSFEFCCALLWLDIDKLYRHFFLGSLYWHGTTLISAMISNHIPLLQDDITCPFPNFNGCNHWSLGIVKYFILDFIMDAFAYPLWDWN